MHHRPICVTLHTGPPGLQMTEAVRKYPAEAKKKAAQDAAKDAAQDSTQSSTSSGKRGGGSKSGKRGKPAKYTPSAVAMLTPTLPNKTLAKIRKPPHHSPQMIVSLK